MCKFELNKGESFWKYNKACEHTLYPPACNCSCCVVLVPFMWSATFISSESG